MESPISSVRYIHKAIRTEFETLEDAVGRLGPGDDAAMAGLQRRFDFLYDMVKPHEDGEEDTLFPALDERVYPVSAPYLLDHRTDQLHMREIADSLAGLTNQHDNGERAGLLRDLNRLTIVVSSAMAVHIRKEEEILVPLIEQHFSVEEQADIVNRAVAHFSPEQLQQGLPWIVKALTPEEQEAYLRVLMRGLPPKTFHTMMGWIAEGVSPKEWVQIVRRIPEAA